MQLRNDMMYSLVNVSAAHVYTQTKWISSDIKPCEVNVCQNGGTCTQSVDLVTCDCPEGFAGKQCQTGNTCSTLCACCGHCMQYYVKDKMRHVVLC